MTKKPVDEANLHHKPTKEELEANADKAYEELQKMKEEGKDEDQDDDEEERDDEQEEGDDEEDDDEEDQEGEDEDDEGEGDDEESGKKGDGDGKKGKGKDEDAGKKKPVEKEKKVEKKKEDEEEEDDKEDLEKELDEKNKKLVNSTREAQILYRRNKKVHEAIEKAATIAEPTDEELKVEFPEWDKMSEFERKMAKQTMTLNRRLSAVTNVTEEFKNEEAWQQKVDAYLADPATLANHPELDGKEDEFRIFATKPTRINLDFADLAKLFVFDMDEASKRKPKNKGKMFEDGQGGHKRDKPKSDKISLEQARKIRETDYNEYRRLVKAKKIDTTSF